MNLIELKNFKRFQDINIEIREKGLTLISGVNNSGKTSILHALAVWEYAKILLVNYRGCDSLLKDFDVTKKGLGIATESFSPISIPSVKYLWKNQKTNGSYDLKIKVGWVDQNESLFLELAYTLNGNNFAIKKSYSNLKEEHKIPIIAYLPPFGGMDTNEAWLSIADRRKLIGKGQAGSVIRNLLLDLHVSHEKTIKAEREAKFPNKKRLYPADKEYLEKVDTEWRQLKKILAEVFHVHLYVHHFDSKFHNFINIDVLDLTLDPATNKKERDNTSKRDLMVEGSGFLQWISVFALALDKNNDILLLDEPDAHLHSSLQSLLLEKLEDICSQNNKQVLMVSHSSDLIKLISYKKVLHVENEKAKYLSKNEQKVVLLEGLGSKYFPLWESILSKKKILLVESNSDTRILQKLCKKLGKTWPENLVEWVTNQSHKERKTLIIELNKKIMEETGKPIASYSLRDLDDQNYNITNIKLHDNGQDSQKDDSQQHDIMKYRTLRRREIENYLIIPNAISRYITGNCKNKSILKDTRSVENYLSKTHGLLVPNNYKNSDRESNTEALFNKDAKKVLDGVTSHFKVKFEKEMYIESIQETEICDDLVTIIDELIDMCALE